MHRKAKAIRIPASLPYLSWRHERLDQLRIRPAMIQRSRGLLYQGGRKTGFGRSTFYREIQARDYT